MQTTVISQYKSRIHSPYSGLRSLKEYDENASSVTATVFLGSRLWKGAALYVNPELAGGSGVSAANGVAGFPNGETFRVGSPEPKVYLARGYVQQVLNLGKDRHLLEDDNNQVNLLVSDHALVIMAGKFCLADLFDDSSYSHDPRTQFMNWSLMSAGAWDYPADVRGYTHALALAYNNSAYSVRAAVAELPTEANGADLENDLGKAYGLVLEGEKRYRLRKQPGTVRFLLFYNNANMGSYREALRTPGPSAPDITAVRAYGRSKYGFSLNAEQQLNSNVGAFGRLSWNDGKNETWAFTEIDRSLSLGTTIGGRCWHRTSDEAGAAVVINDISKDHADYLAAGGYGFIIGDGALDHAPEAIAEVYYSFAINKYLSVSPDYQFILHPAYNSARGPAQTFAVRVHGSF